MNEQGCNLLVCSLEDAAFPSFLVHTEKTEYQNVMWDNQWPVGGKLWHGYAYTIFCPILEKSDVFGIGSALYFLVHLVNRNKLVLKFKGRHKPHFTKNIRFQVK